MPIKAGEVTGTGIIEVAAAPVCWLIQVIFYYSAAESQFCCCGR